MESVDETPALDEEQYFRTAVLLMLHRQYEVLLAIAMAAGWDEADIKEMVESHRKNKYDVPFEW